MYNCASYDTTCHAINNINNNNNDNSNNDNSNNNNSNNNDNSNNNNDNNNKLVHHSVSLITAFIAELRLILWELMA